MNTPYIRRWAQSLIAITIIAIVSCSFISCASEGGGGMTPENQQALINTGTTIATSVLDAWLSSHPFGASNIRGATLNMRNVENISDQELLASMKMARQTVREREPALSYKQADRIVREVYAKKFGQRARNLRYHPGT